MSLLHSALTQGRKHAKGRMTETVTVGLYEDGTNPAGAPTRTLTDTRYTGVGRVKYPTGTVSDSVSASQPVATQRLELSIPSGSARLHEGDEVHVTASTADAGLVGRRYTVAGAAQAGQTTAHRYPLTEVT